MPADTAISMSMGNSLGGIRMRKANMRCILTTLFYNRTLNQFTESHLLRNAQSNQLSIVMLVVDIAPFTHVCCNWSTITVLFADSAAVAVVANFHLDTFMRNPTAHNFIEKQFRAWDLINELILIALLFRRSSDGIEVVYTRCNAFSVFSILLNIIKLQFVNFVVKLFPDTGTTTRSNTCPKFLRKSSTVMSVQLPIEFRPELTLQLAKYGQSNDKIVNCIHEHHSHCATTCSTLFAKTDIFNIFILIGTKWWH